MNKCRHIYEKAYIKAERGDGMSDKNISDLQIIELYFKRDEKAISETADKYGKYCFSVANNILSSEQDAEECVNDTWLRAWNSIPPQRPGNLRLFLAKIARNLAFDRFKKLRRKKRGGGEIVLALEEIGEFVPGGDRVQSELEERELMRAVNRFLHSLPERERNIFINRYFHVETAKLIAEKYGLTEGNVQKILSRTRMKLKKYLETEGYSI